MPPKHPVVNPPASASPYSLVKCWTPQGGMNGVIQSTAPHPFISMPFPPFPTLLRGFPKHCSGSLRATLTDGWSSRQESSELAWDHVRMVPRALHWPRDGAQVLVHMKYGYYFPTTTPIWLHSLIPKAFFCSGTKPKTSSWTQEQVACSLHRPENLLTTLGVCVLLLYSYHFSDGETEFPHRFQLILSDCRTLHTRI